MQILRITERNRLELQPGLEALETQATYPLGSDFFKIDHGDDYFHFFRRLGLLTYYAIVHDDGTVIGAAAGILRRLPFKPDGVARRTFYLCDLKISPAHRGRNVSLKLATYGLFRHYLRCPRGYAITMNDPSQKTNRIVHLAHKFRWASTDVAGPLLIFSLDAERMNQLAPVVVKHRGPLSYLSLRGIKDIVLQSTGAPMPLLHVQFGPCAAEGEVAPLSGHTHMFCTPSRDPLAAELKGLGYEPSASATILHHRMRGADWSFILTSDI